MLNPSDLREKHPLLWYHLLVLLHDLRSFASSAPSRARLDSVVDASYISAPYFTTDECALLKSCTVVVVEHEADDDEENDGGKAE